MHCKRVISAMVYDNGPKDEGNNLVSLIIIMDTRSLSFPYYASSLHGYFRKGTKY